MGGLVVTLTARRQAPSLMGRVGRVERVGRVGRAGRVGRVDGPEKCPLYFFILCRYIDYIYVYLYTKLKLSPTILWV